MAERKVRPTLGGWRIDGMPEVYDDRAAAEHDARIIVAREGGGRVSVYGEDGGVEASIDVEAATDAPQPQRGNSSSHGTAAS